jgi:predicted DNA-binding ribbon-helix-helix protein
MKRPLRQGPIDADDEARPERVGAATRRAEAARQARRGAARATASQTAAIAGRPVKRSFTIAGHRTSISLEPQFWDALKALASERVEPAAQLIGRIDASRGASGLSSAVRSWILHEYRLRAARPERQP